MEIINLNNIDTKELTGMINFIILKNLVQIPNIGIWISLL